MRAGIENFPLQSNKEVRQGREKSKEKGPREKTSLFSGLSQRVIIVCFEMGVPYFKVRRGARPMSRAMGILPPNARTWKRGERERIRGNGISLTLVSDGCHSSKASESPIPEFISVSW